MITELGKFLRKLRIDNDEILKDMADKLNVSIAFLSAVENGKKKIPQDWENKLIDIYDLNNEKADELGKCILKTNNEITINLKQYNLEQQNVAISFARKLKSISEEDLDMFKKVLENLNKEGDNE